MCTSKQSSLSLSCPDLPTPRRGESATVRVVGVGTRTPQPRGRAHGVVRADWYRWFCVGGGLFSYHGIFIFYSFPSKVLGSLPDGRRGPS